MHSMLKHPDLFSERHIGPSDSEIESMLKYIGQGDLTAMTEATVPADIRLENNLKLPAPLHEHEVIHSLRQVAERNKVFRSYIGMGYHNCIVPPVIQRKLLENPGWYTQYTPYQAEIAQGRLGGPVLFLPGRECIEYTTLGFQAVYVGLPEARCSCDTPCQCRNGKLYYVQPPA